MIHNSNHVILSVPLFEFVTLLLEVLGSLA